MPVLRIYEDAEALSRAGAELFAERAMASMAEHGRFVVLLAGGSTPRRTYQLLSEAPLVSRVPWPDCHFFWGDERCLPTGHEQRNETMVRRALLNHLPVPPSQIHPIRYHQEPEQAASDYATELRRFFAGQQPRFDLILLGLGDDGHTASLLPGSAALHEQVQWTAVTRRPEEPFSRVTLTAPLLNRGANTVFLVGGRGKAAVLHSLLNATNVAPSLPAQLIRPQQGELLWLVDREAASQLEGGYGEPGDDGPTGPLLSVIIPTLNEAANLPLLLADLGRQRGIALEVIVGDGGSVDGTEAAASQAGARFVQGPRGRGAQMNAAVVQARGAYLLFLHADSRLDDPHLLATAVAALRRAEQEQPLTAGHFRLHFLRTSWQHDLAYRFMEAKTGLNRPGTTNGDQGLLLSRLFFDRLGGFDESLPFLEDQRIAAAVRSQGTLLTLPGVLATSARRFESEGFHRRYLLMGMMMAMYTAGEWAFFHRAPTVYRVQQDTGRLLLTPIFALLWSMALRDWGLRGTLRLFYRLGRYLRENAWQVFLFVDVRRGGRIEQEALPLLSWHDRVLARWLNFRPVDALAGLLCFSWYMVLLGSFFWLQERLALQVRQWRGLR